MDDSKKPEVHKGLVGVYIDDSKVSKIVQETNSLTYRGYAVQDLCASCKFEEVAFLMWHGELPTKQELADFEKKERSLRAIEPELIDVLKKLRHDAHPMDVLRTAISFIGAQDPNWADESKAANLEKSLNMMAKLPTIVAAWSRIRNGEEPIAPRTDLSYSENFFNMTTGKVPEPAIINAFDKTMILYAEHSFNVSTFTARTITSSLSDIYSAVTGAIGSLKGRLHGGANEAVLDVIQEIGEPEKAQAWLDDAIAKKKTIMGFGHRVYKNGDSRVPTLKGAFNEVSKLRGGEKIGQIMDILEQGMLDKKNIKPNVDFPTAGLYHLMGIEKDLYTPLFVMARITGWTTHVMEQLEGNKLIRPLCTYSGEAQRSVVPMDQRGTAPKATPAQKKPGNPAP
ncbi:MAG: bifunctional 2-methylcitrate synthase/citrate synthase [Alphaproteobacteria bacterium]|nr:MAG: bifunctional 2-methylcitrate synthase/citrate synthase [Alphaproteobacteria bacterium]